MLTYKPTPQLTHLPTPSSRAARFWTTVMYHNLVGIPIPSVKKGAEVLLYQYKICPFCNSVKALLHHQNIPYSSVEVNPLTKSQLGWSKEYKKVPVAVFQDGEVVNDSAQIMDAVLARRTPDGGLVTVVFDLNNVLCTQHPWRPSLGDPSRLLSKNPEFRRTTHKHRISGGRGFSPSSLRNSPRFAG